MTKSNSSSPIVNIHSLAMQAWCYLQGRVKASLSENNPATNITLNFTPTPSPTNDNAICNSTQQQKKYSPKEEAQWTAESVHKALDLVYSLPLNP